MYEVKYKFKNGQEVRDIVSGLTGIVDCCALWLNGCKRYSIQPKMKEGENKKPDSWWVDEEQLELISEGVNIKTKPVQTGGPSFKSDESKFNIPS